MLDIFFSFLKLGLTAFGGPVAHLSFFRRVFVEQKQWLNDAQYAELVAMCQVLPGPASSQVGFCLGWLRGGAMGALLAFVAFTAPSVLLLVCFAIFSQTILGNEWLLFAIDSLKLLAIFVVFQAVIGMRKSFCTSLPTYCIALAALILMLSTELVWLMPAVILSSMFVGVWLINTDTTTATHSLQINISQRTSIIALTLLIALFLVLSVTSDFIIFYQAGLLVFGGGHVVLPLLETPLVGAGIIDQSTFISGYGATQIVPGPIFTFASYLGYELPSNAGFTHSAYLNTLLATLLIFAPGFLIVVAALPYWQRLNQYTWFKKAIWGASASVVGILAATLIDPIMSSTVKTTIEMGLVAVAILAIMRFKLPLIGSLAISIMISAVSYLVSSG